MDRATWTGAERGTRATEDYHYAGIERALGWAPGSIRDILNGDEPTVAAAPTPADGIDLEHEIARIKALDIPAATKFALVRGVIDLAEQMQQERSGARSGNRS